MQQQAAELLFLLAFVSGEIILVFSILFKLLRHSHVFERLFCACLWYAAPNHLHLLLTHTWLVLPVYDL